MCHLNYLNINADAYNAVTFLGAFFHVVVKQIEEIEAIKKICENYLVSLAKDENGRSPQFKKLTNDKYQIVEAALKHLNDPSFDYSKKIAHFQNELK